MSRHVLSPAADESLRDFVRRAMKERGFSVPQLVAKLDGVATNDERLVKRLRSGKTQSVEAETAQRLGPALDADFTAFIRTYAANHNHGRVTPAQILEEVRQIGQGVEKLQEQQAEHGRRLAELERRLDPS